METNGVPLQLTGLPQEEIALHFSTDNLLDPSHNEEDDEPLNVDEERLLHALNSSPDISTQNILFPGLRDVTTSPSSDSSAHSPFPRFDLHFQNSFYDMELFESQLSSFTLHNIVLVSTHAALVHLQNLRRQTKLLELLHKPRGSQGVWQPVQPGEGLRVTKGKGKRLKLRIRTNQHFDKSSLDIYLVDLVPSTPIVTKDGFTVENSLETDDPCMIDLEIKLTRYCKRIQFLVTLSSATGVLQTKTVVFCSHNNGKASKTDTNNPHLTLPPTTTTATSSSSPNTLSAKTSSLFTEKKRKDPFGREESINVVNYLKQLKGPLDVHGVVRAKAFLQFSDLRLKTDISDLVDALDIVSKLQGKTYCWKNDGTVNSNTGGNRVIGLIAQEVQKVLPEVVYEDKQTGLLSVSYAEIVPILIEAFKQHLREYSSDKVEVHAQLGELRAKLEKLENENKPLNSRTSQYQILLSDLQRVKTESPPPPTVPMDIPLPPLKPPKDKSRSISGCTVFGFLVLLAGLGLTTVSFVVLATKPKQLVGVWFLFLLVGGIISMITIIALCCKCRSVGTSYWQKQKPAQLATSNRISSGTLQVTVDKVEREL